MKHLTSILLLLAIPCCWILAQKASPTVLASAGDISHGQHITLEWTLGELATNTIKHPNGMLTEGFHQPILQVEDVSLPEPVQSEYADNADLTIHVFPNPVTATLWIDVEATLEKTAMLLLLDAQGQMVTQQLINLYTGKHELDMQAYPAGMYQLIMKDENETLLKHSKIIKIR